MESSAEHSVIGRRKSLSVDPLFTRGDYVTRRPIDHNRKSRKTTAEARTGSRRSRDAARAWCRSRDDAHPVIVSRRRPRRRSKAAGTGDSDDDTASLRNCYIYWPHSRSLSTGDLTTATSALNLQYDSADRLSDVGAGCRLPGTKDSKALKNLLVLGGSVVCWLTAFSSIQSLQSTLNHRRTLGVASLAALYSAATVSCFYAPPIIRRLSAKWTIVAAYAVHLSYVAANFDETGSFLIPGALAAGALTGPLWSAQCTYLTTLALGDSDPSTAEATIARFNGLFGGLMQTSQIWGNLLSSVVLSAHNETFHLFTQPAGDSAETTRRTGNNSARCAQR